MLPVTRDVLINRALRLPGSMRMRARIRLWRALGARVGPGCWIRDVQLPANPWNIEIGAGAMLEQDVVLITLDVRGARPAIRVGDGVYINRFTVLDAAQSIEVGAHTMIGPHCYLTDHDHGTQPGTLMRDQEPVFAPLVIGCNVWIGAGVMLLKGVTVGDDAVIGAGAVVTRDVAPGARVAGVPARLMPARPHAPDSAPDAR